MKLLYVESAATYQLRLKSSTLLWVCMYTLLKTSRKNCIKAFSLEIGSEGWRRKETYYAVYTAFSLHVSSIDRSLELEGSCGLTRMDVVVSEMVSEVLFDHTGGTWAESEVLRVRLRLWKLKNKFEPHTRNSFFRRGFIFEPFCEKFKKFRMFF